MGRSFTPLYGGRGNVLLHGQTFCLSTYHWWPLASFPLLATTGKADEVSVQVFAGTRFHFSEVHP